MLTLLLAFATNDFFSYQPISIDIPSLSSSQTFSRQKLQLNPSSKYIILFFFDKSSCSSCVTRELAYFNEFEKEVKSFADFIVVANNWDYTYIRNIKRVGKTKCPILLNVSERTLPLHSVTLALIDKASSTVVMRYFPKPDPSHAEMFLEFKQKVSEAIKLNKP